jgi:mevalonate kinase
LTSACASGKAILFGEHAVVYGRPAIAVPVSQVRACATIEERLPGEGLLIEATDLHVSCPLGTATAPDHPAFPLEATVRHTLQELGIKTAPDLTLRISSTVPIACGLGSGAAVATAIVRVLSGHLGCQLPPLQISQLVYQTEIIHHGTPSGIDNTVIAFERPVYFFRGQPIRVLAVKHPFWLLIADTGVASPTKIAVADVRRGWQQHPGRFEAIFDQIAAIAVEAAAAIATGETSALGTLMNENHQLLVELGVSSPELDRLARAAREAGAPGAKLSGAGRGGNMIAQVLPEESQQVTAALYEAGATNVIVSRVEATAAEHDNRD